jgi:hypothetical protein
MKRSEQMGNIEHIMKLASFGIWPWSLAVMWLIAALIIRNMKKAKPELLLVGISFIVIIAVGVLAHQEGTGGNTTTLRTGDVSQQGTQNAAGVAGDVSQTATPCDKSSTPVKK